MTKVGKTACPKDTSAKLYKCYPWGVIQGNVALPEDILTGARLSGQQAYAEAQAVEFCGDAVDMLPGAAWMKGLRQYLPLHKVRELGFEPGSESPCLSGAKEHVYFTYGVGSHVDGIGPALVLVLANDGLKFWQGRVSHVTKPGEWFIFDDRKAHGVRCTKDSTSYVFCHLEIKAIRP